MSDLPIHQVVNDHLQLYGLDQTPREIKILPLSIYIYITFVPSR